MACKPTTYAVSIDSLASDYGATFFRDAFARYIVGCRNPGFNRSRVERESLNVNIPFISVSVYHRVKFVNAGDNEIVDTIHVEPRKKNARGQDYPGRFDTVLVRVGDSTGRGKLIHGTEYTACTLFLLLTHQAIAFRVAQVRVVFAINKTSQLHLFQGQAAPPDHLAYIEWFTPFRAEPELNSRMYKVAHSLNGTARLASVIPVHAIEQSIHLTPLPGCSIPREWCSNSVLEHCPRFLVNSFTDRRTYLLTSN
jgi:hypothetical protein